MEEDRWIREMIEVIMANAPSPEAVKRLCAILADEFSVWRSENRTEEVDDA